MIQKTYLAGKDAALEETINLVSTRIEEAGIPVKPVSWLNPATNCWSVHISVQESPHLYTNGKGTCRLSSLASGLGEFAERLSTDFLFNDYFLENSDRFHPRFTFSFYPEEQWFPVTDNTRIPTKNDNGKTLLNDRLFALYNPDNQLTPSHLLDSNSDSHKRGICALPFWRLSNNATYQASSPTYFPVSLLGNLYVSNGMAAGNTEPECCAQALSEIIERYVKNVIISNTIALPDIPTSKVKEYPLISEMLDSFSSSNQTFSIRIKDGSLGGQFPVICALLTDMDSGGCYAAFGASLSVETAIIRTLTELMQGRKLDELGNFLPPSLDREMVSNVYNLESHFIDSDGVLHWSVFRDTPDFSYVDWDFKGSTHQEMIRLIELIEDSNFQIYRAEYRHFGIYSCRVLVPGMSEIYPVDDLLWNNRNTGAKIRSDLLQLNQMDVAELKDFYDKTDSLELADDLLIGHIIGILFDKDSNWDTLRLGELRALILLAMGNREKALVWCNWCVNFGQLPAARLRIFKLLTVLIGFESVKKAQDHKLDLTLFYSKKEILLAKSIYNNENRFFGLKFSHNWAEISGEHKKLLQIYAKVRKVRANEADTTM